MTKIGRLIALFSPFFITTDFMIEGKAADFRCPLQSSCGVDKDTEPICSPAFGDEKTRVMIVAEAPSKRKKTGGGPHVGGQFKDRDGAALRSLLNFVRKYYNTTPHFTDLMKCGVAKQTKELKNAVFPQRRKNCPTQFLLKEIQIIDPELILCLGRTSYDYLSNAKASRAISKNVKIINLIHYGSQANLPLNSKDKETIIWPLQLRKISGDEILNLSSIKKILENNSAANGT